jgi:hypothetical protein
VVWLIPSQLILELSCDEIPASSKFTLQNRKQFAGQYLANRDGGDIVVMFWIEEAK